MELGRMGFSHVLRDSITDSIYSILSLSDSSDFNNDYQLITVRDVINAQQTVAQTRARIIPSMHPKQPSSVIPHTLSALQHHCVENNISYDSIDNVCELKQKINQNNAGAMQENTDKETKELLKFQFSDLNMPFKCNLYYPIHFYKLRQQLFGTNYGQCNEEIETDFIQSLSQCSLMSTAGKKGTFCKTSDEKYLLKFVKADEFNMFLDNFGSYYDHISNVLYNKMASLLIPIIGAYGIQTYSDSKSMKYVLVMPNLFYGKNAKLRKFDLKGTANTNRYSDKYEVKLDKNYIEYIRGSPVVLDRESLHYLSEAIDNNTQFLAESNIMDYSMLVGIDSESHQIIGGIIDYLETYSWKKRAETTFKSLFRTDCTIQKPSIYKQRFQESILKKYFVSVQC